MKITLSDATGEKRVYKLPIAATGNKTTTGNAHTQAIAKASLRSIMPFLSGDIELDAELVEAITGTKQFGISTCFSNVYQVKAEYFRTEVE